MCTYINSYHEPDSIYPNPIWNETSGGTSVIFSYFFYINEIYRLLKQVPNKVMMVQSKDSTKSYILMYYANDRNKNVHDMIKKVYRERMSTNTHNVETTYP